MTSHTATPRAEPRQTGSPAYPLTRSPLAARPLLLLLVLSPSLARLDRPRSPCPTWNARQLRETGDHPDRQCLEQVIIRAPRVSVSGLSSQLTQIMRLISSLRPARAMACRARSGLDKPIKQTLSLNTHTDVDLPRSGNGLPGGPKATTVCGSPGRAGKPSLRLMPCPPCKRATSPSQLTFRLPVEILV